MAPTATSSSSVWSLGLVAKASDFDLTRRHQKIARSTRAGIFFGGWAGEERPGRLLFAQQKLGAAHYCSLVGNTRFVHTANGCTRSKRATAHARHSHIRMRNGGRPSLREHLDELARYLYPRGTLYARLKKVLNTCSMWRRGLHEIGRAHV